MSATLTSPGEGALNIWVIYNSPRDYPGLYVVRRWESFHGIGVPTPTADVKTAPTLEAARNLIPDGLVCLSRASSDEPQIVETWL